MPEGQTRLPRRISPTARTSAVRLNFARQAQTYGLQKEHRGLIHSLKHWHTISAPVLSLIWQSDQVSTEAMLC